MIIDIAYFMISYMVNDIVQFDCIRFEILNNALYCTNYDTVVIMVIIIATIIQKVITILLILIII